MLTTKLTVVILVLIVTVCGGPGHRHLRSVMEAILYPKAPAAVAQQTGTIAGPIACEGCTKKITVVDDNRNYVPGTAGYTVSEEEFTALRIEYIKNQILKKLRLKKKPKVTMSHLPKAVSEHEVLLPKSYEDYVETTYFDDFYGRTTQAIVFPYEGKDREDSPSGFPFSII